MVEGLGVGLAAISAAAAPRIKDVVPESAFRITFAEQVRFADRVFHQVRWVEGDTE